MKNHPASKMVAASSGIFDRELFVDSMSSREWKAIFPYTLNVTYFRIMGSNESYAAYDKCNAFEFIAVVSISFL